MMQLLYSGWKYICVLLAGGYLGVMLGERRFSILSLALALVWGAFSCIVASSESGRR